MTSNNQNSESENLASILLDNSSSLIDLFENSDMGRDIENNEPQIFENSPYYNSDNFLEYISNKNSSFLMISLNCQSLNAKYEQLKSYVQ